MNLTHYILKLAIAAALAYGVANAVHSGNVIYVLMGAVWFMTPIAGNTVDGIIFKLKGTALGAIVAMVVDVAFQGNYLATFAIGPPLLLAGGYWFKVSQALLNFSITVFLIGESLIYEFRPEVYVGLRFGNNMLGLLIGVAVDLLLWPERDVDKLEPAFSQAIAAIRDLYNQIIEAYQQGTLDTNKAARQQLGASIEKQLGAITSILGNAQYELWLPFANAIPYQRWFGIQENLKSLFLQVADLDLALRGGDGDRLYQFVQPELVDLIQSTRDTFDHFSQTAAFQSPQSGDRLLANLSTRHDAIHDRLSQMDTTNLPSDLEPHEVTRVAASIYGLEAIASELGALGEAIAISSSNV